MWFMFVSFVHPVAIRRAVFCMVWSLLMLVSDMIGDQTVLAYSRIGLVIALYVATIVSFCLPQFVPVRDLRMLFDLFAAV